jgi:signal peptidase complex subunit 3
VAITNPEVLRMRYINQNYASGEQAFLQFDIDADLTGLWNWNVKQLFVFLMAEYQTKHSKLNQVTPTPLLKTPKPSQHGDCHLQQSQL